MRRVLRLMPALWAMVLVTLVAVWLWQPGRFARELRDAGWVMLYASNWVRALRSYDMGYFRHTWTLALEEQFYLLWPVLMYFLVRRGKARLVLRVALILAVLSWLWRIGLLAQGARWKRVYGLDTLLELPLWGCALAAWRHGREDIVMRPQWALAALAAVLVAAVMQPWETGLFYSFGYTFAGWLTAAMILDVTYNRRSLLRRWLCWPPLVQLGAVSYGFYLWHYVLPRLLRLAQTSTLVEQMATIIGGTAAAMLSFYIVERPFLRLKKRFEVR